MKQYKDYNYLVTKNGKVWSNYTNIWLKQPPDKDGYPQISIHKDGKQKTIKVHKLVLETFVGCCPKNKVCRHLDGNPANNNLDNLCWDTQSNNIKDRAKHGTTPYGEKSPNHFLTQRDITEIRKLYQIGKISQHRLAFSFGTTQSNISLIVNNKRWNN